MLVIVRMSDLKTTYEVAGVGVVGTFLWVAQIRWGQLAVASYVEVACPFRPEEPSCASHLVVAYPSHAEDRDS